MRIMILSLKCCLSNGVVYVRVCDRCMHVPYLLVSGQLEMERKVLRALTVCGAVIDNPASVNECSAAVRFCGDSEPHSHC